MTVVAVNPDTFTQVNTSGKGILQAQGGSVQLADTGTPAAGDYIVLQSGELLITEVAKYARSFSTGCVVVRNAI